MGEFHLTFHKQTLAFFIKERGGGGGGGGWRGRGQS